MKFKCEIELDNDAFVEPSSELSDVLKKIARQVDEFHCDKRTKAVWDYNGNNIGSWVITND